MEPAHALLQAGGRRLLSDCTVVGSVGVGGSIAILLLIGFVVGAGASALLFWWRQQRQVRIELEYRNRFGDAVRSGLPMDDVNAMVKAATTPTIARAGGFGSAELAAAGEPALAKAASAMGEGPLGMGVAGASFKHDPLRGSASAPLKQQFSNPMAGMPRTSSGNPFAGEVPSFNVLDNAACSLDGTPSPPGGRASGLLSRGASPEPRQQPGLIGTAIYGPASDPSSPRITKPAAEGSGPAAGAVAPPAAPPSQAPSPFAWPSMAGAPAAGGSQIGAPPPQPSPSECAVELGASTAGGVAAAGAGAAAGAAPAAAPTASSYLAALDSTATNPFETPARQQREQQQRDAAAAAAAAAAKAAEKQELLQQVQGEAFGDDDLDPEWAQLLGELDGRLAAAGRPCLSARERAVAIRSLVVATASQSADAALKKALADVEAFRRASSFRGAA